MVVNTNWSDPATAKASGGLDFTTGDTIDEATLDRYASNLYALGGSSGHIGARAYNAANSSINSGVATALTFNSERYDTDPNGEVHSITTNTGRLTCRTAGTYLSGACVRFAANGTGSRQVSLRVNGTTTVASQWVSTAGASINTDVQVSTVLQLAAGDYVEVLVFQDSGGTLNVEASGNFSPECWLAKV